MNLFGMTFTFNKCKSAILCNLIIFGIDHNILIVILFKILKMGKFLEYKMKLQK